MIQFIAFLVFTGFVGFFSWRATRRDDQSTTTGYFLAGRSLPWIVVGGSLLLTNLSTEQLVGLNGLAFNHGMQVMAWEVWSSSQPAAQRETVLVRQVLAWEVHAWDEPLHLAAAGAGALHAAAAQQQQ